MNGQVACSRRRLGKALAVAVVVLGTLHAASPRADAEAPLVARTTDVTVVTREGNFKFRVELADTPETQARGLMYRMSLPAAGGMLFDFGAPKPVAMWMKNTYVPLDIIFLNASGHVVDVAESLRPLSTTIIQGREPALAVLELQGGTAKRIGLGIGDYVEHPMFKRGPAPPASSSPR
jgi:uncharacterized membrane protein (UPF0127 family)